MSEVNAGRWWGEFELAEDERRWWMLGPLLLGAERKQREWRFGFEESPNGVAATAETNRALDELANAGRFVFANPGAEIRLTPALADRAVVTRPLSPLYIAPGEEATLFVSSPAWVRIEAVTPELELADIPVERPSDTWFGPSTREGELCYATRTNGRLRLEDLPVQPYRVITPLEITNESKSELKLERVSLPVPFLTIYSSDAHDLWTQKVKMICEGDAQLVTMGMKERNPSQISGADLVAAPRKAQESQVIKRALSSLFN